MIPKIIHYIWLGDRPMPPALADNIEEWKKILPSYQFLRWGDETLSLINSTFVNEAIAAEKWAFASDVIRLWVLYNYGGVYLDTDVILKKDFSHVLNHSAFIGRETCLQIRGRRTEYDLTSYCLGAEKGSPFIYRCLSYYKDRHFILSTNGSLPVDLRLDIRNASEIFARMAASYGYNPSARASSAQTCDMLAVLPKSILDDYCSHLSLGSWREQQPKQEEYTIGYKIRWRVERVISTVLGWFHYTLIKIK